VLQEREFERVGGTDTVKVDVRVVSATHRNLEKQIAAGTFREDLYYRLNVFPIVLPPLRERPGDIALLGEHFVGKYARSFGKSVRGLDAGARAALVGYSWPGNVRELENVIERALILSRGPEVTAADLEFTRRAAPLAEGSGPGAGTGTGTMTGGSPGSLGDSTGSGAALDGGRPLQERLSEQERSEIVAAIDQSRGNIAHAARRLGINRSTLYYRLRKHGLEHLLPMKEMKESTEGPASRATEGPAGGPGATPGPVTGA
jgi:DNA-binding NtrC family response regulator